jgi:hypothetical protein
VGLCATAAVIAWWLWLPPVLGVADNGDYARLLVPLGLRHTAAGPGQPYTSFVDRTYERVPPGPRWYLTSAEIPARIAVRLAALAGQRRRFDLRFLSVLYGLAHLVGCGLLLLAAFELRGIGRWVAAALLVALLTDAYHVAYFNSFYAEGFVIALFTVMAGCAALLLGARPPRPAARWALLFGYFACAMLIVSAKPQHIPLALPLAAFGALLAARGWDEGPRRRAALALAAVGGAALLSLGAWSYRNSWRGLNNMLPYLAIFLDLVPHSPDPRQDLAELGLDPEWVRYAGVSPFPADSPLRDPEFAGAFAARIRPYSPALFYLSRPARLHDFLARCAGLAFVTRLSYMGYVEAAPGRRARSQPWSWWTAARERLVPRRLASLLIFFVGGGTLALVAAVRRSSGATGRAGALGFALVVVALSELLTAAFFGGGTADLQKHLYLFHLAFDGAVLLAGVGAVSALRALIGGRRRAHCAQSVSTS